MRTWLIVVAGLAQGFGLGFGVEDVAARGRHSGGVAPTHSALLIDTGSKFLIDTGNVLLIQ